MQEKIKLTDIAKISLYINDKKESMSQIKEKLGCDHIINAGLFDMKTFKPINTLIHNWKELSIGGNPFGYGFNGNDIRFSYGNQIKYPDFIGCCPCLVRNSVKDWSVIPSGLGGTRGRSAIGLTNDSLILYCSKDGKGDSLRTLTTKMIKEGCINAINLDGGGSSQGDFNGRRITSSRIVHNFICIWAKNVNKEESSFKFTRPLYYRWYRIMKGEDVKYLQKSINRLIDNGKISTARLSEDGSFGKGTRTGVMSLQRYLGVTADGSFGNASQNSFYKVVK